MSIEKIICYVLHTPYNTNKAILKSMLKDLILSHGGTLDGSEDPDDPNKDVIYDGGMEV